MPGIAETRPHDGERASSAASAGFLSDQHLQDSTPTLDQLETLASAAAGLHFANELVGVVHERNAARQRSVLRQRQDAHDAVTRTLPVVVAVMPERLR